MNIDGQDITLKRVSTTQPFSVGATSYKKGDRFTDISVVRIQEHYGLVDSRGQWAIQPAQKLIGQLYEDRAVVETSKGKWGFIDSQGITRIKFVYNQAHEFHEGRALVLLKRKWGFIDVNGRIVIPIEYLEADDFRNGRARVRDSEGHWGHIDHEGRWINREKFAEAKASSEGLTPVMRADKWGYVDSREQIIIPLKFDDADPFDEGVARVAIGQGIKRHYGLINKSGRFIVKPIYLSLGQFSDGLARVDVKGKEGFMDRSGHIVIPAEFDEVVPFEKGLARVSRNGHWGFINTNGTVVIRLELEFCQDFSDGLAAARTGGLWGYLDKHGKWVIAPQFRMAESFDRGFGMVDAGTGKTPEWRRINRQGQRAD